GASLNEAAAFPTEVLPASLRPLIEEGARALSCPPDFLAIPLLVLAGVAIGNSRAVEIKHGWQERARIWAAIVSLPGSGNSPALELVSQPFARRQQELTAAHQPALKAYQAAKEGNPNSSECEPLLAQVVTTDATPEALADLLAANPRGIAFVRDELAGW